MNQYSNTAAIAALALAAPFALAGEGDVGLLVQNGQIVTALADDETGAFENVGERVFGGDVDFVSNLGDGPGFFTTDGPTLPAGYSTFESGSTISYRTNGALQEWNGNEFVATSNQLRQIVVPNVIEILSPSDNSTVDGFEYGYSGGEFDEHPDYAFVDASSPGIYLWNITFGAMDASGNPYGDSQSVFIVFNFGLSELEHDAAIEFAESIVPAPGAVLPLIAGGLFTTRRRR